MPSLLRTTLLYTATIGAVLAQSSSNPVTGSLGNATVSTNNPEGAYYIAVLPNLENTNIRGAVVASTTPDRTGVSFQVTLNGFPTDGGPFLYHIHEHQVPTDGNCTATGAHLDPLVRGEIPSCDASLPMTCQVGDLAGKHGTINDTSFSANYIDDYASTAPSNAAFVGNRSIVVHFANKTRITCANFEVYNSSTSNGTLVNTNSSTAGPTASAGAGSGTSGSSTGSVSGSSTSTNKPSGASTTASTGTATIVGLNAASLLFAALAFFL